MEISFILQALQMSWLRFYNIVTKGFKLSNPLKTKGNDKIYSKNFVAANNPWAFILFSGSQAQFSL